MSFGISFPPNPKIYGSFSYNQTKVVDGADTPTVIPLDTVEASNGVRLENNTQVVVPISGTYQYNYSLQLDKDSGGTTAIDIWIRINGTDVPRTASQVTVQGQQGEVFPFVNYILELRANDFVELVFASSDATVKALFVPEWTTPINDYNRPAIPSLIVNMTLL
jgi:hypothetical protein